MKKLKLPDFNKLFENNRFLQVFSVVAALFCWFVVAMTQSYTTTLTIRDVPITLDPQAASLQSLGLHVIEGADDLVNVKVRGVRSVVAGLKPDDFTITVKVANVTETGTYDLTLQPTAIPDCEILSITPDKVRVSFDRIDRRSFDVKEEINGLSIAANFTADKTVVNPSTINIEGPAAELDKINKCIITTELEAPLERTYAGDFPIILYDANGNVLDPGEMHLTLDHNEAHLTIPVLKNAHLPLEFEFSNIPKGFPIGELEMRSQISENEVMVAGPADVIDKISEIQLDYIPVKNITMDNTVFEFEVKLPEPQSQFIRLDNVFSVVVNIDDSGLSTAYFNVPEPKLLNVPVGYDATVLAKNIPSVQFVGETEVLEAMTADDIVAEIDLSERTVVSGSYQVPVKICVPGKGLVWAVGDQTVTIQVEQSAQSSG